MKSSKQQAIELAWGDFYNPSKYHYSINGWRSLHEVEEDEMYEMMQKLNLEFREHTFRPKSLNGIETTNILNYENINIIRAVCGKFRAKSYTNKEV